MEDTLQMFVNYLRSRLENNVHTTEGSVRYTFFKLARGREWAVNEAYVADRCRTFRAA
jgi:uncharacterized protein Usg